MEESLRASSAKVLISHTPAILLTLDWPIFSTMVHGDAPVLLADTASLADTSKDVPSSATNTSSVTPPPPSNATPPPPPSVDNKPQYHYDAAHNLSQLRMNRQMWQMAESIAEDRETIAAESLPNIAEEFVDFPAGFTKEHTQLCQEALQTAYVVYRTQPWLKLEMLKKNKSLLSPELPAYSAEDFVRRWGGTFPIDWLEKNAPSEYRKVVVVDWKEDLTDAGVACFLGYNADMRSNSGNCPARKDILSWNSTHVAVGFNDLMYVLRSSFESSGVKAGEQRWFKFVGIDMSPYSIAKTEVVAAMLLDHSTPVTHVMQVWFSSTWSRDCLDSFRRAVDSALLVKAGRARIEGLQSVAWRELNGKEVVVTGVLSGGQMGVKVGADDARSLKIENLVPVVESEPESSLHVGDTVRIVGLQSDSESAKRLNGRSGKLESFDESKGRWAVRIEREEGLKEIKPANLILVPEPEQAVIAYLKHWRNVASAGGEAQQSMLTVEESRSAWWATQLSELPERYLYSVGSLCRKKDRLAVCKYLLTGDLFSSTAEEPEIGSVVMWNVPDFAPPQIENGSALGVVCFEDLVAFALNPNRNFSEHVPTGGNRLPSAAETRTCEDAPDVVSLFTQLIESGIKNIVRSTTQFKIELICDTVAPENKQLISKIANLQPYTMSWSNVIDYLKPTVFHEIARRCSPHGDCIHMAYSMNWSQEILGANIMDFLSPIPGAPDVDYERRAQVIKAGIDRSKQETGLSAAPPEWSKRAKLALSVFLTSPLREDPENLISYTLAWDHYITWANEHFMKKGKTLPFLHEMLVGPLRASYLTRQNSGLNSGTPSVAVIQNPLQRVSTSISLLWTYDPDVPLVAQ